MKARLTILGVSAALIMALALQASPQAVAQGNANKPAAKKAKPAATKSATPAPPAQAAAPAAPTAKKPVHRKKTPAPMTGVPSGVSNCIKSLSEMASKDPLPMFEGRPEEIVNNGLLWNDPKSKCSVGSDQNMRKKISELATVWRLKDAAKVRSLLQELEGKATK